MSPEAQSIKAGSHGPYRWLTSDRHYVGDFVKLCPEALLGRFMVVTSIDSGIAWLTAQQETAGWKRKSDFAYSPRLVTTDELYYQHHGPDSPGFDEWFLFEADAPDLGESIKGNPFEPANSPRPGNLMVFVNYYFAIDAPNPFLADIFWRQLDWVKPESYLSDGQECLTFVSRNSALFENARDRLLLDILPHPKRPARIYVRRTPGPSFGSPRP